MKKNKFDTDGSAFKMGTDAEKLFEATLKSRKTPCKKSSKQQDIWDHIDYFIKQKDGSIMSVDLKAQKKIRRGDKNTVSKEIWVEFKNVRGNKGWLYGKADYIVFEQPTRFVFVNRLELVEFCESNVDLTSKVDKAYLALYKSYTRNNREDVVSIVKYQDMIDACQKIIYIKKL